MASGSVDKELVYVHFPNNAKCSIVTTRSKCTVEDLIILALDKVGIPSRPYFHIVVINKDGSELYTRPGDILTTVESSGSALHLRFKFLKHFSCELSDSELNWLFHQVRTCITSGIYPIDTQLGIQLAALSLQASDIKNLDDIKTNKKVQAAHFHPSLVSSPSFLDLLSGAWVRCALMSPYSARAKFVHLAHTFDPYFGLSFVDVKDTNSNPSSSGNDKDPKHRAKKLAIAEDGIHIFSSTASLEHEKSFLFDSISRIALDESSGIVDITIRTEENDYEEQIFSYKGSPKKLLPLLELFYEYFLLQPVSIRQRRRFPIELEGISCPALIDSSLLPEVDLYLPPPPMRNFDGPSLFDPDTVDFDDEQGPIFVEVDEKGREKDVDLEATMAASPTGRESQLRLLPKRNESEEAEEAVEIVDAGEIDAQLVDDADDEREGELEARGTPKTRTPFSPSQITMPSPSISSLETVDEILREMRRFSDNVDVLEEACLKLIGLTSIEENVDDMSNLGGVDSIVHSIQLKNAPASLCTAAIKVLCALAENMMARRLVVLKGAVDAVLHALKVYGNEPNLTLFSIICLKNLATNTPANQETLIHEGVLALCKAIRARYVSHGQIIKESGDLLTILEKKQRDSMPAASPGPTPRLPLADNPTPASKCCCTVQ